MTRLLPWRGRRRRRHSPLAAKAVSTLFSSTSILMVALVVVVLVSARVTHAAHTRAVAALSPPPLLGHCKVCILVLETLRSQYPFSLPTICQSLMAMAKNGKDFEVCQEVVAVLSAYGPSVALWQREGCFRTEEYGAVEQLIPCPAHVICSQMETMKDLFTISDYDSKDKYDRHNLRVPQIRPKKKYQSTSELDAPMTGKASIQTFCPVPKPQ
jgi:hypothetical protein